MRRWRSGLGTPACRSFPCRATRGGCSSGCPVVRHRVVFDGIVAGERLSGTIRQGALHGTFHARRGENRSLVAAGFYSARGRLWRWSTTPMGPSAGRPDSGAVNALYPLGAAFSIGSGFAARAPSRGAARFGISGGVVAGSTVSRQAVRQLEVRFRSGDAVLSGTLTLPGSRGLHAAVAFVTGSGETSRAYLPSSRRSSSAAALRCLPMTSVGSANPAASTPESRPLRRRSTCSRATPRQRPDSSRSNPEIDRARVGLAGHSQAGWIMPLAASRNARGAVSCRVLGSAVTASETDLYQNLTGQGERPQGRSDAAIDAQVIAAGRGGVDPMPWIRKLRIPALWVYGGRDEHVPPRLSVRRLAPVAREPGRDFSIRVFPNANHALVETKTGLTSEMLRSDHFAPGMFAFVRRWLRARVVT